MADTQIAPLGVVTAPADYTIPNAQEMTLAAMFAHYDGSGAGSAYVPTLQIVSDSGHTVLEVPQDASVAAGSSVEASWAPFLKTVTSTTVASTKPLLYEAGLTNFTLASGAIAAYTNIGGFSTTGDDTAGRVAISGGNSWTLSDPSGSNANWILNANIIFTPASGLGAAGLLGLAIRSGPDVVCRQEVPVLAGIVYSLGMSVTSPVQTTQVQTLHVSAYQNTGINYTLSYPDDGNGFSVVWLGTV